MGLEKRGNNYYYYQKERIGDKVRSVYAGKGDIALMLHWLNEDRKEQRKYGSLRDCIKAEEAELNDALDSFSDIIKVFIDGFYLTNGFHQHKRQWRRKRNDKRTNE
ncbi:MAG: hypothetical protein LUM44_12605 [Pyrinomonadaceae bacterium]|nr:hypothetical protein [Pyrinomonadaceae bacterium]